MHEISVIIPFFNSFNLMDRCLFSLENQTLKKFEIIFVDDCSTDNSNTELKKYLNNSSLNYKIIKNKVNSGPGFSRKMGVSFSNSDYVSFIDSDDSVSLDYIEKLYKCIKKINYDIILFDYNRVLDGKFYVKFPTLIFNKSSTKKDFLAYAFDSMCCMLFKKQIFNNINFPDLYNGEDVALIPLLISKSNTIGLVKEPLYNYINNKGSLSNTINSNVYLSFLDAYKIIRNSDLYLEYNIETEFLGIKIILYNSVLTGLKAGVSKEKILNIIKDFEKDFDKWYDNPYIRSLSIHKRIYLYFLIRKKYLFIAIYVKIHNLIFN